MKKLFVVSAAISALFVSACAEEPEVVAVEETAVVDPVVGGYDTVGTTWDTNADGVFQEAEYRAWGANGVTAWDTDSDGLLSEDEFGTGWTDAGFSDSSAVFTAWDDDSDGLLSDDEFFDDEEWSEWDTNRSGVLETNEFVYY